jgi:hypothetical protein
MFSRGGFMPFITRSNPRNTRLAYACALVLGALLLSTALASSAHAATPFNCAKTNVGGGANAYCPTSGSSAINIVEVYVHSNDSNGGQTQSSVCASVFSSGWSKIYNWQCDTGGAGYAFMGANDFGHAAGLNNYSGNHYIQVGGLTP